MPVSAYLQTKNLDYIPAWNYVLSLQEKMDKLTNNFSEIYQNVKDFITIAKSKTERFEHVYLNDELPVHRQIKKKNEWTVNWKLINYLILAHLDGVPYLCVSLVWRRTHRKPACIRTVTHMEKEHIKCTFENFAPFTIKLFEDTGADMSLTKISS